MQYLTVSDFRRSLVVLICCCGSGVTGSAWDVGPPACRNNACSQGALAPSTGVSDTNPKYANSVPPSAGCPKGKESYGGLCYNACTAGYHRTGACTCGKDGAGPLDHSTLWTDCSLFDNATAPVLACSEGRELYGGLCYLNCPPDSTRTGAITCVHAIRWRANTHLWIVQQALLLLSSSGDPKAKRIADAMNNPANLMQWQNGLWDADEGPLAESATGRRGSHFYNASGKDYSGAASTVVTYLLGSEEQASYGNARTNAKDRLVTAGNLTQPAQWYSLGIALHYLTDMTQPMHVSGFSGVSIPIALHPIFEYYAGSVQSRFSVNTIWDRRWNAMAANDVFHQTSLRSSTHVSALMSVFRNSGTTCTMTPEAGLTYTGNCFIGDPAVDAKIGEILRDAYQSTASYIYAALKPAMSN